MKQLDTKAARELANADSSHQFWAGQMRQTLEWACDIIDAANAALKPKRTSGMGVRVVNPKETVSDMSDSLAPLFNRLRGHGGRYLLGVSLTPAEFDAQPTPTYGGKGHVRWLTDEEYGALCALPIGDQTKRANDTSETTTSMTGAKEWK